MDWDDSTCAWVLCEQKRGSGIEGSSGPILGNLATFIEKLEEAKKEIDRGSQSVSGWCDFFSRLLRNFVATLDDTASQLEQIGQFLSEIEERANLAGMNQRVTDGFLTFCALSMGTGARV